MTPRTPKPKPVEAWAVLSLDSTAILSRLSYPGETEMPAIYYSEEEAAEEHRTFYGPPHPIQLVRIVPVTEKRTTKKPAKGRGKK